jgi:predicted Zn-dependent protease
MSAVMDVLQGIDAYQHAQQKSEGAYWRLMEGVYDKLAADHPTPKRRKAKLGHVETIRAAADPEFLAQLDGLDFGAEKKNGTSSGRKVYFAQWNLMLEVPEGWTTSMSPNKLWIFRKDGAVRMSLERVSVDTPVDLCEALLSYYSHGASLANLQRASENGVRSCAGLVNGNREALSLLGIVVRDDAPSAGYVFRGFHRKLAGSDPDFLSIARSIELPGEDHPKPPVVRIRTVGADDTFAALAKNARVPNAEAQLRLLNQRYPSGELVPGQLVKVIE